MNHLSIPIDAPTNIQPINTLVLSSPLKRDLWLATGISNYSEHRRSIISYQNLGPFLPERYAIDWIKLDSIEANGSDHRGDGTEIQIILHMAKRFSQALME